MKLYENLHNLKKKKRPMFNFKETASILLLRFPFQNLTGRIRDASSNFSKYIEVELSLHGSIRERFCYLINKEIKDFS